MTTFSFSAPPGWTNYTPLKITAGSLPPEPQPGEEIKSAAVVSFAPLDPTKMRSPFTYAPLPPEFLSLLGQIAVLWGQYESLLNGIIEMLSSHNSAPLEPNWQRRLSYEQRTDRFVKEAQKTFRAHPFLYLYLKQIVADAAAIQTKRNVLLHGTISLQARIHNNNSTTDLQTELKLIAVSRQKKQDLKIAFGLEELENLFYDMGHLAGRLLTITPGGSQGLPSVPYTSWQCICLVQGLLRNHHPDRTKPNTHQSPPGSSEG